MDFVVVYKMPSPSESHRQYIKEFRSKINRLSRASPSFGEVSTTSLKAKKLSPVVLYHVVLSVVIAALFMVWKPKMAMSKDTVTGKYTVNTTKLVALILAVELLGNIGLQLALNKLKR
jgi:hypothetical protein